MNNNPYKKRLTQKSIPLVNQQEIEETVYTPAVEPQVEEPPKIKKRISFKTWVKSISIVIILIFFAILYWSPKTIVEPLKYYLNDEYGSEIPEYSDEAKFNLTDYAPVNGKVSLDEGDVYKLINSGPQFSFEMVALEEGKLIVFKNMAKTDRPLWLGMEIEERVSEETGKGEFVFSRVGFGRFALPNWLVESLMQKTYGKIVNAGDAGVLGPILKQFLGSQLADILHPENVEFKEATLELEIKSGWGFLEQLGLEGTVDEWVREYEDYDLNGFKDWMGNLGWDAPETEE